MRRFLLNAEDLSRFAGLYIKSFAREVDDTVLLLGAVDDQAQPPRAAGLLAARVIDAALTIEWLYVLPEYRRQGVASSLLDTLLHHAYQNEEIRGAAAFFSENQPTLEAFFRKFDFHILYRDGWGYFRGTLGNVADIPNAPSAGYSIMTLTEVSDASLRAFNNDIVQRKTIRCGVPLPINANDYAPQSRVCCINNEICGMLLLDIENNEIELRWLFAPPKHRRSLPLLLNAALSDLKQSMPPETPLSFGTLARPGQALAERLLPDAEWIESYTALLQF